MISIEAWRGTIGNWAGRARLSPISKGPRFVIPSGLFMDIIWGISTCLIACLIYVLLIVGAIEINPGPPRKDINSSSEDEVEVPESFDFGEDTQGKYVFCAPVTPIQKKYTRRVLVGSKKRSNKFGGHQSMTRLP